jgi:hypothetical protein
MVSGVNAGISNISLPVDTRDYITFICRITWTFRVIWIVSSRFVQFFNRLVSIKCRSVAQCGRCHNTALLEKSAQKSSSVCRFVTSIPSCRAFLPVNMFVVSRNCTYSPLACMSCTAVKWRFSTLSWWAYAFVLRLRVSHVVRAQNSKP